MTAYSNWRISLSFTSYWPVLGLSLILIGLIVKFEIKLITSEEHEELSERPTENQ
tara:strand:- start:275 stop:439 length:165 start_codon:yes stop_codon:yes gene_type:complete